MNKLFLFIPLLTISFLTNCGNKKPLIEHTLTLNLHNCTVENQSTYIHKYVEGNKIDSVFVKPDAGYILNENSISSEYKDYWQDNGDDTYTLSNLVMNKDYTIDINASQLHTLTLNLTNCNVSGASTYTHTYIVGTTIDPVIVTPNTSYALTSNSISSEYKNYWQDNGDGTYTLSNLVMNKDYTIDIKAGAIYSITAATQGIIVSPNKATAGVDCVVKVEIDSTVSDKILSEIIDNCDIRVDDHTSQHSHSITEHCQYTLKTNRKKAEITIPGECIINNIKININLLDESVLWYKKTDWWNYCSSGIKDQQALPFDIGKTAPLTIDGVVQNVRLIDIDRDAIAETNKKAHCTFDFVNAIKNFVTEWRYYGYETKDFVNNSKLNVCLQPDGDVYKKMPAALMEVVKKVTKTSRYWQDGGENWKTVSYTTQLFPFSREEIIGDGNSYAYYKTNAIIRRKKGSAYWLRSPDEWIREEFDYAWFTNTNGEMSRRTSENKFGVVPVFCI